MTEPIPDFKTTENKPIRKRTVVLFPGFDPRGASHYHKLLSKQFDKYAEREAMPVSFSPRKRWKQNWHCWNIQTEACEVTFLYAEWDDIVRKYWQRGKYRLFIDSCQTYLKYLGSFRFVRGCSGLSYSQISFYYPIVTFILLYLFLMSGMAAAAWSLAEVLNLSSFWKSICIFSGIICGGLLSHKISPRLNGGWLLRIFCFTKKIACKEVPELEVRLPTFAQELAEHVQENPPDELLIVGHSVGAIMSVRLLHGLLENTSYKGHVSYMSMGQCVQLVSFLETEDGEFNLMFRKVVANPQLSWVDFTMPSDGASIVLQDPVRSSFKNPPEYPHKDLPKFLSARLMEGYSPKRFKELKRDHFQYHFQYYMTPDKRAEFEFPSIVLSDKLLAARYAHRENQARNRLR